MKRTLSGIAAVTVAMMALAPSAAYAQSGLSGTLTKIVKIAKDMNNIGKDAAKIAAANLETKTLNASGYVTQQQVIDRLWISEE